MKYFTRRGRDILLEARARLNHNVYMVFLDADLSDPPSVDPASLIQQPLQADGYFT
jgi:hypothetical protein